MELATCIYVTFRSKLSNRRVFLFFSTFLIFSIFPVIIEKKINFVVQCNIFQFPKPGSGCFRNIFLKPKIFFESAKNIFLGLICERLFLRIFFRPKIRAMNVYLIEYFFKSKMRSSIFREYFQNFSSAN